MVAKNEQRYAIVRDGTTENVVVWDGESEWSAPEGTLLVQSDEAAPGDIYDGKTFTRPEAVITEIAPTAEEQIDVLTAQVALLAARSGVTSAELSAAATTVAKG